MLYYTYLYIFRASIFLKLKTVTKMDDTTALYKHLIKQGLKFLPFWNLVSVI